MTAVPTDPAVRDAFAERLFTASIGAMDLLHAYLGRRLGLYAALEGNGSQTPSELAQTAAIAERYAREWLEHQAVAGFLEVDDADEASARTYTLPAAHAEVLLDADSLAHMPVDLAVASLARALPLVVEAFRSGGGVPYEAYGEDIRSFIAQINRPMFWNLLAQEWFPQVPGLVDRLTGEAPARVADVGCGTGWSAIAIARGFADVAVVGLDLDEASIAEARANAGQQGVHDRVTFEVRNAADPGLEGQFDLVCAFETIHDMADPVGALRAMRGLAAADGFVLVVDERVADSFTTDVDDGERFQWGWSALHCLPCGLTEPPAAGLGTILRTPVFRDLAHEAGFADVTVLPIDNDFWRFYQLHP